MDAAGGHRDACWRRHADPWKVVILDRAVVGPRVLDIGCGYGWYCDLLLEKGLEATGLDRNLHPRRPGVFVQGSASELPFADGTFDTVVAFDVMEHIDDHDRFLEEVRRVCRSRLILSVPNEDDRRLTEWGLTYKHHRDKTHRRQYEREELESLLRGHGFECRFERRDSIFPVGVLPGYARSFWRLPVRAVIRMSRGLKVWEPGLWEPDLYAVCDRIDRAGSDGCESPASAGGRP